jgi:hypothetical protein
MANGNGKIKTSSAGNKKKATGNWANELKKLGPVEFAEFEGMVIEAGDIFGDQAAAKPITRGAASPATAGGGALNKNQVLEIMHLGTLQTVYFPAFLKTYQDSYNATWNRESIYGRMDPIQTYSGTQRIITLNWEIVAVDLFEAKDNLFRVGKFAKMMYPVYKPFGNYRTIQAPPLVGIRHTNIINGVTGINAEGETGNNFLIGSLDSIVNQPNLVDGVFEDSSGIYPKIIDLNFTFHPIHNHELGYDTDGAESTPEFPYNFSKAQDDGYENTVGGASDEIAGAIIGDVLGGSGDGGDFTDYLPDFVTDIFGGN